MAEILNQVGWPNGKGFQGTDYPYLVGDCGCLCWSKSVGLHLRLHEKHCSKKSGDYVEMTVAMAMIMALMKAVRSLR